MPFELIRRREGEKSDKQEIRHKHTQFSINSFGHLCIREYDDPEYSHVGCTLEKCCFEGDINKKGCTCQFYGQTREDDEHLIVLDQKTTEGLIKFIFDNRSTYELRELLKGIIKHELPF